MSDQPIVQDCFACGRSYCPGDGRFCSTRCRAAFDDGFPPYAPVPTLRDGVTLDCCGCRKPFLSRGLRCSSADCERNYRKREENTATLAETGIEVAAKRKCVECGGDIPRYVGVGKTRREVSLSRVTCSPKCQRKLGKQTSSQAAA